MFGKLINRLLRPNVSYLYYRRRPAGAMKTLILRTRERSDVAKDNVYDRAYSEDKKAPPFRPRLAPISLSFILNPDTRSLFTLLALYYIYIILKHLYCYLLLRFVANC